MNNKQPELTLFQGISSIHIDNNQMQREEEEAIEDQKRRDAEVRNQMKISLFTLNSSYNCSSMKN